MKVVRTRDGMHPRNPIKTDILSVVFMTKSPERRVAAESEHGQNYRERSERHLRFSPNLSIPVPKVVVTIGAPLNLPRPHLQKRPRPLANQQQPQPKRRTQSYPHLDHNLRVHGHSRAQNTCLGQIVVHAQLSNIVGRSCSNFSRSWIVRRPCGVASKTTAGCEYGCVCPPAHIQFSARTTRPRMSYYNVSVKAAGTLGLGRQMR